MKYIIDVHNSGNQQRRYGNFIYDATITIEGMNVSSPADSLFKHIFKKVVCNYEKERLGGMARWAGADLLEYDRHGNTAYMRAERYYDD